MDTTDTTTTDLVIIDAELMEDDTDSVAHNVGKTVATTAATSAVVIGAILLYKYAAPKVASFFTRSTDEPVEEIVEEPIPTPETEKV